MKVKIKNFGKNSLKLMIVFIIILMQMKCCLIKYLRISNVLPAANRILSIMFL